MKHPYPCARCHKPILWVLDFWLDPCTGQINHKKCQALAALTLGAEDMQKAVNANTTQTRRVTSRVPNQDRVRPAPRSRHQTGTVPVVTGVDRGAIERKLTAAKATLSRARAPRPG